ncbi:hypothetical protein BGZ73_004972 [Actinomortierella ambigua]|nr:hypothetical protein BGZ73_004972 [Actinomortierella ambigua]
MGVNQRSKQAPVGISISSEPIANPQLGDTVHLILQSSSSASQTPPTLKAPAAILEIIVPESAEIDPDAIFDPPFGDGIVIVEEQVFGNDIANEEQVDWLSIDPAQVQDVDNKPVKHADSAKQRGGHDEEEEEVQGEQVEGDLQITSKKFAPEPNSVYEPVSPLSSSQTPDIEKHSQGETNEENVQPSAEKKQSLPLDKSLVSPKVSNKAHNTEPNEPSLRKLTNQGEKAGTSTVIEHELLDTERNSQNSDEEMADPMFKAAVLPEGQNTTPPSSKAAREHQQQPVQPGVNDDTDKSDRPANGLNKAIRRVLTKRADDDSMAVTAQDPAALPDFVQLLAPLTQSSVFQDLIHTILEVGLGNQSAEDKQPTGDPAIDASLARTRIEKRLVQLVSRSAAGLFRNALKAVDALTQTNEFQSLIRAALMELNNLDQLTSFNIQLNANDIGSVVKEKEEKEEDRDRNDKIGSGKGDQVEEEREREKDEATMAGTGKHTRKQKQRQRQRQQKAFDASYIRGWQKQQRQNTVIRISILNQLLDPLIAQIQADLRDAVTWICQGLPNVNLDSTADETDAAATMVATTSGDGFQFPVLLDSNLTAAVQKCLFQRWERLKTIISDVLVQIFRLLKDSMVNWVLEFVNLKSIGDLVGPAAQFPQELIEAIAAGGDGLAETVVKQLLSALPLGNLFQKPEQDEGKNPVETHVQEQGQGEKEAGGTQSFAHDALSFLIDRFMGEWLDVVEDGLLA